MESVIKWDEVREWTEDWAMDMVRLSEEAWLVRAVVSEAALARMREIADVVDVVRGYETFAVYFDLTRVSAETIRAQVEAICSEVSHEKVEQGRIVEIPVVYDGEDLEAVASYCGLSVEDVVRLHGSAEYEVMTLGFVPGFVFLRGLPELLQMPRRAEPRTVVPAGSVGIAGAQTGVYPTATPGGWHLIGRTDVVMFDAMREEPSLVRAGDRVRFVAVNV
jgi:KipI family sensor histidine kinase inhibitor